MSLFFALLIAIGDLLVIAVVVLACAHKLRGRSPDWVLQLRDALAPIALPLAWLVALGATLGSLYYSEVANFTPCELCWYQRIAMYPWALILAVAAYRRDTSIKVYAIPVVIIGGSISIYHYLEQRFPDTVSSSCDPVAPCTAVYVWKLNYVSIPMMALTCFAVIAALLVLARGQTEAPRREAEHPEEAMVP